MILDAILGWATKYRNENMDIPNRVALWEREIEMLYAEAAFRTMQLYAEPAKGEVVTIYGMQIESVTPQYSGPRAWASNPKHPKSRACWCCGAPWEPLCRYCAREG